MWGIANLKDFGKRYVRFMASIGAGANYAPGVEQKWKRENFKRNPVTHDRERHARCQGLIAEEPRLALAGPTVGWVAAAADAMEGFQAPNALAHVRLPILVFTAEPEECDLYGPVSCAATVTVEGAPCALFARLCLVTPDGRSTDLCDGALALPPGTSSVTVPMAATARRLRPGERLRLQLSGPPSPRFAPLNGPATLTLHRAELTIGQDAYP